jgi:energy-coupling factor transporter ATP-binding protein EcfA2
MEGFGKEVDKLRKLTGSSIKELTRSVEEEIGRNDEEQVSAFMRTVHMDISSKLKSLQEQRERTEERVLSVLERVVSSCIPEVPAP